jgi:putative ABC transport system permease protein
MFQSYFKIGWRNLLRNKSYSFINIGGLAVGMTVAILNGLWIWDELSFNKYHENYSRIAQVASRGMNDDGGQYASNSLQYPLTNVLETNYHHSFKHLVRASWEQDHILSFGEKKIGGIGQFIEHGAPEMLSLEMIYGTWAGLKDPHSIMISMSIAKALFGSSDPTNKMMRVNSRLDVKVTGVFEDLPLNSRFHQVKFFCPWELWVLDNNWIQTKAINDWDNHFIKMYAEILPGTSFTGVSEKIKDAEIKNLGNFKEQAARKPEVFLHPMSDWHLFPLESDGGPVRMIWLVGTIGVFVLLLACINFMNLSTARSERRAKEVGVRKTMGSLRTQLINQFFSESFCVVILAFLVAIFLVALSLPAFNNMAEKQISMPLSNLWFWMFSLGFILVTGILAGSYPALFLSSFEPVKVLKGTFRVGRFASVPRKVLVVIQFTVSVVLIISTIIVHQQIQHAKNRPLGYSQNGIIMLEKKSDDFYGKHDVLRNELISTGTVEEMSESMGKITEVWSGNNGFDWRGKNTKREESFGTLAVTHEHGKTVGWQFVEGRDFSRDHSGDSTSIVVNEAALNYMGLKNPIGEPVTWKWRDKIYHYKIIGVIKDMVMESPYEPISPTLFFIKAANGGVNWINIKINPSVSIHDALPKIEAVFKKLIPTAPFDYRFADQDYALKFGEEERIGKLASVFSTLAIFISCLGLFGLASFVAEQRTKEIGIRKVVGASVFNIWKLLSKDFVVLVITSCVIAVPIAYYFLFDWLQNYEYRIQISWWVFFITGFGAMMVTLITVSFQAVKAALLNPVESLRSE